MVDHLALIGRSSPLFAEDFAAHREAVADVIGGRRVLVVGGAGSIGSAVVKRLFTFDPATLHVVDVAENNLAELVRDLRSALGYGLGEFNAFCVDLLGPEFDALLHAQPKPYDLILHFAALKHVRSEKDPFTLMRMLRVNVLGAKRLVDAARTTGVRRLFAISTDKAASPINLMGASKRIMEGLLLDAAGDLTVSSARFANVLFSDGPLPCAWEKRSAKRQPIVAPRDARRYFVTHDEAALLCLMGATTAATREVYFPNPSERLAEVPFDELALRYLDARGISPVVCESEDEARDRARTATPDAWPCFFFDSDTTGEKDSEEFFEPGDAVDLARFADIGVLLQPAVAGQRPAERFAQELDDLAAAGHWEKAQLVDAMRRSLAILRHHELGRSLDDRM